MNVYLIIAIYWLIAIALSYGIKWLYYKANPGKKLVNKMYPKKNSFRMHLTYIFIMPIVMPLFLIFVIVYMIKEPSEAGKYFAALKGIGKGKNSTSDDDLPF